MPARTEDKAAGHAAAVEALRDVPQVPGASKPDPILVVDHVSRQFGGLKAVDVAHMEIQRGAITALIGPNGAGKTTIFKMIMGEEKPDNGEFEVGDTTKIAYVDQSHSNIDADKSIWENFSDGQDLVMMGGKMVNSRAYLSRFNFAGSEQNKKVSALSGGERNRLHITMKLKEEGKEL